MHSHNPAPFCYVLDCVSSHCLRVFSIFCRLRSKQSSRQPILQCLLSQRGVFAGSAEGGAEAQATLGMGRSTEGKPKEGRREEASKLHGTDSVLSKKIPKLQSPTKNTMNALWRRIQHALLIPLICRNGPVLEKVTGSPQNLLLFGRYEEQSNPLLASRFFFTPWRKIL